MLSFYPMVFSFLTFHNDPSKPVHPWNVIVNMDLLLSFANIEMLVFFKNVIYVYIFKLKSLG